MFSINETFFSLWETGKIETRTMMPNLVSGRWGCLTLEQLCPIEIYVNHTYNLKNFSSLI